MARDEAGKPRESFVNRKRPAVEGLIEDLLGPASQLDEIVAGKPEVVESEVGEGKVGHRREHFHIDIQDGEDK